MGVDERFFAPPKFLKEISLRARLEQALKSSGIQIGDALGTTLQKYCSSSDEMRDAFYPAFDGHPMPEGYEAYAEAAVATGSLAAREGR